jgi:hypothetical protein
VKAQGIPFVIAGTQSIVVPQIVVEVGSNAADCRKNADGYPLEAAEENTFLGPLLAWTPSLEPSHSLCSPEAGVDPTSWM